MSESFIHTAINRGTVRGQRGWGHFAIWRFVTPSLLQRYVYNNYMAYPRMINHIPIPILVRQL